MAKDVLKTAELTHKIYVDINGKPVQIGVLAISNLGTKLMLTFDNNMEHGCDFNAVPWLPPSP